MMIKEVTAGKIMVPGAQLLNRLVSALRRPEPTVTLTEEIDVFDRMEAQLEAIQELRVWRAVRNMAPELPDCPSRPRLIRHLITVEEEEHAKGCPECQSVLKKAKVGPLTLWFEKGEQRWQRFKETTSSVRIRAVQAVVLMSLIATLLGVVSYPMHVNTERMLNNLKVEVDRANANAEKVAVLQHDRDKLMNNLTQLHSLIFTLNKRSEQNQAEQRDLIRRLSVVTEELNALQTKHQESLNDDVAQSHSIGTSVARSSSLQARSSSGCGGCGLFQAKRK